MGALLRENEFDYYDTGKEKMVWYIVLADSVHIDKTLGYAFNLQMDGGKKIRMVSARSG